MGLCGRTVRGFGYVACVEVVHGSARLELNRVLRHRRRSRGGWRCLSVRAGGGLIRESAGSEIAD